MPLGNAWDFIGADRSAHAAAAHCDTSIYSFRSHRLGQRNHKIGIIITRVQGMSANVEHLVSRFAQMRDQLLFPFKARVIGRKFLRAYSLSSLIHHASFAAAALSATTSAVSRLIRAAGIAGSPSINWRNAPAFSPPVTTQRTRRARLRIG